MDPNDPNDSLGRPPTPSPGDLWAELLDEPWMQNISFEAREQMTIRGAIGRARYGTPLQAFNGRDGKKGELAAALDGAIYCYQLMKEGDKKADRRFHVWLNLLEDCISAGALG